MVGCSIRKVKLAADLGFKFQPAMLFESSVGLPEADVYLMWTFVKTSRIQQVIQ